MNWKSGIVALGFATFLAGASHASIITSVTSTPLDPVVGTPTFDFEGGSPLSNAAGTFTGTGQIRQGTAFDSAAPAGDSTHYLSVLGGQSATLNPTKGFTEIQLYIGSLDDYNSFTFNTGSSSETISGSQLLAMNVPPVGGGAVGDQGSGANNRLFDIKFDAPVTSVVFASSTNSLEFDNVTLAGGVPEPGVWGLMIAGFGLLGTALRSSRMAKALTA